MSNRSAVTSALTSRLAVQGDPSTPPRRARISHLGAADRLTRIAQAAHRRFRTPRFGPTSLGLEGRF